MLGKIKKYNIIIIILPNSKYKIASAASIIKDMLYNFPNFKINLIVNISSSALSAKYNIYLNNIIINLPYNKNKNIF